MNRNPVVTRRIPKPFLLLRLPTIGGLRWRIPLLIWSVGFFGQVECILKLSTQSLDLSTQSHYIRLPLLDFGVGLFYCAFTFCSRLVGCIEFFFLVRNYTFELGFSPGLLADLFVTE